MAAWVSVMRHKRAIDSALEVLDSYMLASIFSFAAEKVRRQVLWKQEWGPDTPPEDSEADEENGREDYY